MKFSLGNIVDTGKDICEWKEKKGFVLNLNDAFKMGNIENINNKGDTYIYICIACTFLYIFIYLC